MATLYDEAGNPIEGALTPEEIDAKLDAAKAETAAQVQAEKDAEIEQVKTSLAEKETALEEAQKELEVAKANDKGKNFSQQRKIIEEKQAAYDQLLKDFDAFKTETQTRLGEIVSETKNRGINEMIDQAAGGNKELKDKIRFFYDAFKPLDETGKKEEDIQKEKAERVKNALILATGGRPAVPITSLMISSAGGGLGGINPKGEKLNSEQQDLAGKLGIDQETLKKHKLI
jgi:hypothetical protein